MRRREFIAARRRGGFAGHGTAQQAAGQQQNVTRRIGALGVAPETTLW
jgi:hypothetical protein